MGFLLAGVDEAGFGPLLGPLTIGFAAFDLARKPGEAPAALPWQLLETAVAGAPAPGERRLLVADSKVVFARTPRGAKRLEQTALAFLGQLGTWPVCPTRLMPGPFTDAADWHARHPWYADVRRALPRHGDGGALELAAERVRRALAAGGLTLLDAGVHALGERDYNLLCDTEGNKSLVLWHAALEPLRRLWDLAAGREGLVVLDRQGGRARYGALLARGLPDASVRLVTERSDLSEYELVGRGGDRRLVVRFQERGETASFSTALASCLAKYARELAMDAFNAHFAAHQPGLAPTAGYTQDGRRWLDEAADALTRAGLQPADLVRLR
ncbi:MAG: hypothetical protein GC161_10980 [Planctomycetaceae bacterium]|nr:hypothetical protein [Planctomycetaceae bacterium]